ncbi:multidrug DMT transporter permease [Amycolatopsis thailandensis]|uniref:Multidrug DMT transporter permease n=1 Tax=Amycolatopsis thailandensis TaxID=589330 RepID=A0A229SB01_9PSEU|nr:multidrug DMT transporter permease [Amycolatopsis thailandensis]
MAWVEQTGQASWRVRFRRAAGSVGSVPGFSTRGAAEAYADDMETDQRRRVWIDPAGSRMTLGSWVERWFPVQDVDPRTVDNYESYLRCHVLVRFGVMPLGEITALDIDAWVKESMEAGYATATVASWVKLLSMILNDAVEQRLIPANPVRQRRRRGRRCRTIARERVWASPEQVLRIADQAGVLGGQVARLLVITAAWTGCRWGELAALHRDNLDLDTGRLVVDPEVGSLHESRGRRWLGPPKTPSSARTIALPPFLVRLLRRHLETHPFEFVFTNACGSWLWRSTFDRRVLRPAIDGVRKPGVRVYPVCPGLTFHGLRHSHKTWLIAGGAPEIAQARRLGHHLSNRVVEVYSHVAPEVETRLLADLQRRWNKATRNPYSTGPRQKAPVNTRPRTAPQAQRSRLVSAAPIAAGGRDNETDVAHEQRQRGARYPVGWSDMHQKHPNRDRRAPVEADHSRSLQDKKKPLRPAGTA